MSERNFASYFKKHMRAFGHFQRHEDLAAEGIPDISFALESSGGSGFKGTQGWIELKWKRKYPVRPTTQIRFEHFTAAQKLWLRLRGRIAGNCWVFVQIEREWFLFPWNVAIEHLGKMTRQEMYLRCFRWWQGRVEWSELAQTLERGC